MMKTANKLATGRNYFRIVKVTYEIPTEDIMFNSESLKILPLKLRTRLGTAVTSSTGNLTLAFHIVHWFFARLNLVRPTLCSGARIHQWMT